MNMSKDYRSNKLIQGTVATLPRSVIILNETSIKAGKIGPQGVKNIQFIKELLDN